MDGHPSFHMFFFCLFVYLLGILNSWCRIFFIAYLQKCLWMDEISICITWWRSMKRGSVAPVQIWFKHDHLITGGGSGAIQAESVPSRSDLEEFQMWSVRYRHLLCMLRVCASCLKMDIEVLCHYFRREIPRAWIRWFRFICSRLLFLLLQQCLKTLSKLWEKLSVILCSSFKFFPFFFFF